MGGQRVLQVLTHVVPTRRSFVLHSVVNEWFGRRLAKRLGLIVPEVHRRYVPAPVYLIDRFDRTADPQGAWQRRHAIDACQLLGLDRTFKYAQGSMESLS